MGQIEILPGDASNPESIVFDSDSPEQTRSFGAYIAGFLSAGDFIALEGGLASGKTCFTQGLAEGMRYRGNATSPTFTLLHIYEGGRLPLYHYDVYRLESGAELENIGYEEYFYGDGVCAVEWSDLVRDYLPERRINILFERTPEETRRRIKVSLTGYERRKGAGFIEAVARFKADTKAD